MRADLPIAIASHARSGLSPQAATVGIGLCLVAVLAIFWPTTISMVETYQRSETYQHCFLVIPIFLWLVWGERNRLIATTAAPWWPGLLLIAACGAVWLIGVLAIAHAVSELALVAMAIATIVTVFGLSWARILWFPLLFLFFAVPFGDALVPTMMDWTADFTVAALRASGVPVFREGNFFVIPSGSWSVVEACSGIKFFFSALMLGTLYAWVMYRSLGRRIAFVLVTLTVPFIANWLRAYLTVLIAHLTSNRLMIGFEHLVFGWILFAAALLGLYWLGLRWREDDNSAPEPQPAAYADRNRLAVAAVLGLLALGVWPPLAQALLQPVGDARAPLQIIAPLPAGGWTSTAEPIANWTPSLTGAEATATFTYGKGSDRVGLFVAAFRHQHESAKLATTANRFVANKGDRWIQTIQRTAAMPPLSAAPSTVRAATLRHGSERLVAWQWYWFEGAANSSDLRSKIELARARLLRRPDTGLWIAVFTPLGEGRDDLASDEKLSDFLRSMDSSLRTAFARTTER